MCCIEVVEDVAAAPPAQAGRLTMLALPAGLSHHTLMALDRIARSRLSDTADAFADAPPAFLAEAMEQSVEILQVGLRSRATAAPRIARKELERLALLALIALEQDLAKGAPPP